ncbi:MAG: hypothetical protein U1F43_33580 [Myxococcota bacterium]
MLAGSALPASASESTDEATCPDVEHPDILSIGSSTLGSVLGPMLGAAFQRDGLTHHFYGVASSGLARPDYHDWLAGAAKLIGTYDPDVVVVELGTNDFQPLWEVDHWVRRSAPEWETLYAQRIDALLAVIGGPDKQRLILWMGPYCFAADNAIEQGPVIDRLLRDRLATWVASGGRARYVDAWGATTDKRGWPIVKRKLPGLNGTLEIRTDDGIHLKGFVVRKLFAEPIIETVRACVAAKLEREHPTASDESPAEVENPGGQ